MSEFHGFVVVDRDDEVPVLFGQDQLVQVIHGIPVGRSDDDGARGIVLTHDGEGFGKAFARHPLEGAAGLHLEHMNSGEVGHAEMAARPAHVLGRTGDLDQTALIEILLERGHSIGGVITDAAKVVETQAKTEGELEKIRRDVSDLVGLCRRARALGS